MVLLNIHSRRYYLAFLCNAKIEEPVRATFPGLKESDDLFREGLSRVRKSYKNWKSQVTKAVSDWVTRWITTSPNRDELANLMTHRDIKDSVKESFKVSYLETLFKFGSSVVDFEAIS